jgi:integrase
MAARLEKTRTPGIYRRGSKYVVVYWVDGRQKRESAATMDAARRLKAARLADRNRGERFEASTERFADYALEWVERYQGIRDSTRENYRRDIARYAVPFLGDKALGSITGRDLAEMIAWLVDERKQAKHHDKLRVDAGKKPTGASSRRLSDSTVANAMKSVRACLGSAKAEHLIRVDPCIGLKLPKRDEIVQDDDHGEVRAFTREQLATVLSVVHPKHRDLLELLASTGLRISEALALEWRHLELAEAPKVKVRQQFYRGRYQPPKTRKGRRDVPIPASLAARLRRRREASEWGRDDDLAFPGESGAPLHVENLRRRHLRTPLGEAGASWAGFHTFRHTFASMKLESGAKVTEVAALLGHSSPRVTLDTYLHWLRSDDAEALDLDAELAGARGDNKVTTQAPETDRNAEAVEALEPAI